MPVNETDVLAELESPVSFVPNLNDDNRKKLGLTEKETAYLDWTIRSYPYRSLRFSENLIMPEYIKLK